MKILFVSSAFPKNLNTKVHGVYKRMNMFIDGIKEIASIDMLFYVPCDMDISPSSVSKLELSFSDHWNTGIRLFLCPLPGSENVKNKGIFAKLWHYYVAGAFSFFRQIRFKGFSGTQQVEALEACLARNPDTIFVHKLHLMCPLMRTQKKLPPVYFDLDDIEHIAFKRSIDQLPKWYEKILNYIQLPMLMSGELRAIRLAHKTFVCSDLDRDYLIKRWDLPGVVTVPNAVTIPAKQTLTVEPTILFIGTYSYKPNIDAAEFLINKVWPGIYKIMPQAKLLITGAHPERIRSYGSVIPNVTFTGFVDDLDALYHKTRIVCAPIFAGGGTRVKIVEAAAYGKPVVATKIGAEGLELHDGQELFLRDDAESFTEACLQLLKDYALCERMGAAAHAKAVQLYDRNNILELIQNHINSIPLNPLPSRKGET